MILVVMDYIFYINNYDYDDLPQLIVPHQCNLKERKETRGSNVTKQGSKLSQHELQGHCF